MWDVSMGHHVFALMLVIDGVCSKLGFSEHGHETGCRLQQCMSPWRGMCAALWISMDASA